MSHLWIWGVNGFVIKQKEMNQRVSVHFFFDILLSKTLKLSNLVHCQSHSADLS